MVTNVESRYGCLADYTVRDFLLQFAHIVARRDYVCCYSDVDVKLNLISDLFSMHHSTNSASKNRCNQIPKGGGFVSRLSFA